MLQARSPSSAQPLKVPELVPETLGVSGPVGPKYEEQNKLRLGSEELTKTHTTGGKRQGQALKPTRGALLCPKSFLAICS